MNQISHPFVNRHSIKLGLLPRSSFSARSPSSLATTAGVASPRTCALIILLSTRHMRFAISKNNQPPSAMPTGQ